MEQVLEASGTPGIIETRGTWSGCVNNRSLNISQV